MHRKTRRLGRTSIGLQSDSRFLNSVVKEFEVKLIWEGVVETFDLEGCPLSNRCYGFKVVDWTNPNDAGKLILHVPPLVDSPKKAVQVAIAAKAKLDQRGEV